MVYFDHSASTIPSKVVLDYFYNCNLILPGNYNSPHELGENIKEEVNKATKEILNLLKLDNSYDIIYTSGATEANNYVISSFTKKNNINLVITFKFEHSSIIAPVSVLQKQGKIVEFVNFDKDGRVDLNHLKELLDNNKNSKTLVSISPLNSELGIRQDILSIKEIIKKYDNVYFHTDATQAIGKIDEDYNGIDMISFSSHKFYGLKGVGGLIYRKELKFDSLINGGESYSKYRSGTPFHPLILSIVSALKYVLDNNNYDYVLELNKYLVKELKKLPNVIINSNKYSIPHIVNVSFLGHNSLYIVNELSKRSIYISNHTACSSNTSYSLGVYTLTNDMERSTSSVRISLSFLNKKEEIDYLIKSLKEIL